MAHYFNAENTESKEFKIEVNYNSENFSFISDNSVFSKRELDYGTKLLIDGFLKETNSSLESLKCLDLGCGWGVVGILCTKFCDKANFDFVDVNERAIKLTEENLKLNKIETKNTCIKASDVCDEIINNKYDIVVTNPPFRAGNEVLFKFFSQAKQVLNKSGKFIVVLRRKQGSKTYVKKILESFKNYELIEKDKGYEVYCFTK